MPTPEIPVDQKVIEHPTEVVSETLTRAGITSTPTNVTQVNDKAGKPLISTPVTPGAKIQYPGDTPTLIAWSKGAVNNAKTWLGRFLLRALARNKYANNDQL